LRISAAADLQAAYDELRERQVFDQVRAALDDPNLDEPPDRPLPGDEASPTPSMSRLERFGLTGANLRLKLNGWYRALDRLRDSAAPSLRTWKKIFNWANTILGSLTAVIGAAEALKELKVAAENSYEDAAEDA
jgi:hypothetical protein